jgi:hypothetical protein
VRYLPDGVDVGADTPHLTVVTYPFPGAYPAVQEQAAAKGAVTARLARGGLAVLDNGYPQSAHIAYPGVNYQVEVYDPTPARAMQLVSSGGLRHLGRLKASPRRPRPPERERRGADRSGVHVRAEQDDSGTSSSATSRPARRSATRKRAF